MSTEIRFDGWSLHCGSGELAKGDLRVRLPAQPLLILEELLARPGEVVTREFLVARLWPRGVVEYDTALNVVLAVLAPSCRRRTNDTRVPVSCYSVALPVTWRGRSTTSQRRW
jgi:DNA-binding winged helix-turn-helix (wHTH) protein